MTTPDEARDLRAKAEYWQNLAAQQQELATKVRVLANEQRDLIEAWGGGAAHGLVDEARRIEEGLRTLAGQMFLLERAALDSMARTIADESRALRSE